MKKPDNNITAPYSLENRIPKPISPLRGSFHLIYKDGWQPEFISSACLKILSCKREQFVEVLLSAHTLSDSDEASTTLMDYLHTPGSYTYDGLLWYDRESLPYVLGTLTVISDPSGCHKAYGVLFDRSAFYAQAEHLQLLEEEFHASLQMSDRSIYHYLVDGRQAIIPLELAQKGGIPEVIDNLPEWNVREGRIAPQSIKDWYGIFDAIDRGAPQGEADIIFVLESGEQRRVNVEFSAITDDSGNTVSAIISHQDITEQYEYNRKQGLDREGLLEAARLVFPEILSINLSKSTYRMIQYYQATTLGTPQEGPLEQMLGSRLINVAPEDQQNFHDLFFPEGLWKQYHEGREQIQLTYRRSGQDRIWHWMETTAIRQENPYDDDILYIAVSRNIDKQKQDEEMLREALTSAYEYEIAEEKRINAEERLRKNEQIFSIAAQHSNRTLCYYDLEKRRFRPWSQDSPEQTVFPHLFMNSFEESNVATDKYILPESIPHMLQMFKDIHSGKPSGESHIHVKMPDGELRWFHFKFSCIEEKGTLVTALISFEDVTRQHEKDIAYLRQTQAIGEHAENHLSYIEVDLTTDIIEKHIDSAQWNGRFTAGFSYSESIKKGFADYIGQNKMTAEEYYSPASLLKKFEEKNCDFEDVWEIKPENRDALWVQIHVELLMDSLSEHIKMFAHMTDITAIQQAQLAISHRADYDAMTGLLRRGSGIEQIKQRLSSPAEAGGVLILLDLDDLKGINDTLGHAQGDRAIAGISETLTGHFRKDDILVRLGGDEFMVFLGGAAQSVSSVALAMSNLLKKLAGISIGENGERCIHCSAGCAVQLAGEEDFDALYRRADIALYHVKRNGKNNFSFFEPEMLLADYQFKMNAAAPKAKSNLEGEELSQFLDTISIHFQGIVFFDLSKNQYRILEAEDNIGPIPLSDNIDVFWDITLKKIREDDREQVQEMLLRDALLAAYQNGKPSVKCGFHYQEHNEGYYPASVEVNFYTSQSGDIYAYALFSRSSSAEAEQEILRLKKILEVSGRSDFEYICLINTKKRTYTTYSQDGRNSHGIPESGDFDTITKYIRDTHIAPEDRDSYYEAAALENILMQMEKTRGYYSYHYRMADGTRQTSFTWYEDTHSELLMTVKKV